MKNILKVCLCFLASGTIIYACDKKDKLPFYPHGTASTLSSDVTSVAPAYTDSNAVVLTLTWTYPNYSTDSNTVKYLVQMAPAGTNFAEPSTREVTGATSTSYTGADIDALLLGFGVPINTPFDLEARVVSSYANNNDRLISNVIAIQVNRIATKVPLPSTGHLYITGSATVGGTTVPVPLPDQEFAQINEVTYGGVFKFAGGGDYSIIAENTSSTSEKYGASGTASATGGEFAYQSNTNFPAPDSAGWYNVELNFSTGLYAVTPAVDTVPDNLYIVGSATAGGWVNPVPTPSQEFTRVNSSNFEIIIPLNGGEYLLIPHNGMWDKYASPNKGADSAEWRGPFALGAPDNIPAPDEVATYKIVVSFFNHIYTLYKQ